MRTLSFLIFLCISSCSYCQSLEDIKTNLNLLLNHDSIKFQTDSSGISKLPEFSLNCIEEFENLKDLCHVLDLNQDGLLDLIFSGPCSPYYETAILINEGTQFQLTFETFGRLLSLDIEDNKYMLKVIKPACCCDYYNELTEIRIGADLEIKVKSIQYHTNTKIRLNKEIYSIEHYSGVLRTEPVVNDSIYQDPCSPEIFTGNQLAQIDNKDLVVIGSKLDWDLVLFREDEKNYTIGWIERKK